MWNLHRLRLLRELQLRGTIAEVARTLRFSPSTVSHQLDKLENEVGAVLLVPDGRRVRLTPYGNELALCAAKVMDLEEQAQARLDRQQPSREVIHIAALESVARSILPQVVARLRTEAPHLVLDVSVVPPEEGIFEVEARRFDLAVAEQYPGHTRPLLEGLDRVSLGGDEIVLAVADGVSGTTLGSVRDQPWVLEPEGTAARAWALQQCRAAGFEPEVRFHAASLDIQMRLIAAGEAVGLLPGLAVTGNEIGVRVHPLPESPRRELFTTARESSAERPAIVAVRAALAYAFG